jgi:hypothetical protein
MKLSRCILSCGAFLMLFPPFVVRAQEKGATDAPASQTSESVIPIKLQVLLTEYDGTKKIASLPYSMSLTAAPEGKPPNTTTQVRDGVRVPVLTGSKTGESSMQYIDVGTNIDARIVHTAGELYSVEVRIERSSLVLRMDNSQAKEWAPGDPSPGSQPLIRDFRNSFTMQLREGHGSEATVASDPMSGHVLKVELLLTLVK